jgi:hypothetical protein
MRGHCQQDTLLSRASSMSQPEENSKHVPVKNSPPAMVVTAESAPEEKKPEGKSKKERRSWPRRKRAIQVVLQEASGEGNPFPAWILDRSVGGLRLSVDDPTEEGTVLRVRRLSAPIGTPWVELQVKSVRIKENTWELGCQFTRSLPFDVLMQFG